VECAINISEIKRTFECTYQRYMKARGGSSPVTFVTKCSPGRGTWRGTRMLSTWRTVPSVTCAIRALSTLTCTSRDSTKAQQKLKSKWRKPQLKTYLFVVCDHKKFKGIYVPKYLQYQKKHKWQSTVVYLYLFYILI